MTAPDFRYRFYILRCIVTLVAFPGLMTASASDRHERAASQQFRITVPSRIEVVHRTESCSSGIAGQIAFEIRSTMNIQAQLASAPSTPAHRSPVSRIWQNDVTRRSTATIVIPATIVPTAGQMLLTIAPLD